jgi:hypothetical protein
MTIVESAEMDAASHMTPFNGSTDYLKRMTSQHVSVYKGKVFLLVNTRSLRPCDREPPILTSRPSISNHVNSLSVRSYCGQTDCSPCVKAAIFWAPYG